MNLKDYATTVIENFSSDSKVNGQDPLHLHASQSLDDHLNQKIENAPEAIREHLAAEYLEDGPATVLLEDVDITEIILTEDSIHFEKHGKLIKHSGRFLTKLSFDRFLERVLSEADLKVDMNIPIANGKWRGFRVHVITKPLCEQGAVLTLRRQSQAQFKLKTLREKQTLSQKQELHLGESISRHKSILVVGPTGSGKTTLVNCLIQLISTNERLVILEDTDELIRPHQNCAKLLTRQDLVSTLRDFDLGDLLKESLRMRPDRIIVGEVRGPEAKDLLLALSTGHSGFLGTLHASSCREALLRLEMLVQMGAPQWGKETIRQLILSSLNEIVVVKRVNGHRQVTEIKAISGLETNGLLLEDAIWE